MARSHAFSGIVRLFICLSAVAVLACQDGARTPTEPGGPAPVAAKAAAFQGEAAPVQPGLRGELLRGAQPALREHEGSGPRSAALPPPSPTTTEAKRNGQGGGNGNGGNGNGGHGGNGGNGGNGNGRGGGETFNPALLSLRIDPDHWNTNYDHAAGAVTAFVTGPALTAIDRGSVELVGDDPAAAPLPARRAQVEGRHLRAQFPKSEVLDLLDDPAPGSTHTVRLRFAAEGASAPVELADQIRVVGPGGGGGTPGETDLRLSLQPDTWNTNYAHAAGTVVAKISGPGFRGIDLDSIVLVGSDPAAAEVEPRRVQRVGNHVQAFFGKADAFEALLDPQPGQMHEVTVKLTVAGEAQELKATVRIVGPTP